MSGAQKDLGGSDAEEWKEAALVDEDYTDDGGSGVTADFDEIDRHVEEYSRKRSRGPGEEREPPEKPVAACSFKAYLASLGDGAARVELAIEQAMLVDRALSQGYLAARRSTSGLVDDVPTRVGGTD